MECSTYFDTSHLEYTYTPGVNYPLTGTVIPLTPINCTPGFAVPIS